MGRVNVNSTLRVEDYSATYRKDLLPRLFQTLNLFITQVVSTINGGIEFGANIPSQDNALEFNFDGILPSYKWNLNRAPRFVVQGQAFEDGQPVNITFTWSFDSSRGLVSIDSLLRLSEGAVTTLRSGSRYQLSLRTLA